MKKHMRPDARDAHFNKKIKNKNFLAESISSRLRNG